MSLVRRSLTRAALVSFTALLAAGCSSLAQTAHAQSGTNLPVLVMGEDGDANSVSRRSSIHKRVLAELKNVMQRDGFRMVDEEMIAVDLGWQIVDRRPKTQLIEAAKLANNSRNASHRVRAMTTFTIFASRVPSEFATRINTRIEGELYDVANNQFLGAFELPRETYSAPKECNDVCLTEIVGDRAREIAANLGTELRKKLALLSPERAGGGAGTAPVTGGAPGTGQGGQQQLLNVFTVSLKDFSTAEVMEITRVMREEFPGARNLESMESGGSVRRFGYQSAATQGKLVEWFNIQLRDMGFNVDREIALNAANNQIAIDKLVVRNQNPAPRPAPRFQ